MVKERKFAVLFSKFGLLFMITTIGLGAGLGIYTFYYAKGYSYFSNDPKACVNCHIMQEQYDGWMKSSHHAVATCNDCHTPHSSWVNKYYTKAENGFWHSWAFTTGKFLWPIQIRQLNRKIAQDSCLECHSSLFEQAPSYHSTIISEEKFETISCTRCHKSVGHP